MKLKYANYIKMFSDRLPLLSQRRGGNLQPAFGLQLQAARMKVRNPAASVHEPPERQGLQRHPFAAQRRKIQRKARRHGRDAPKKE